MVESNCIQELLKESPEKYSLMIEASTDMIFAVDLKGNFLFANNAFKKNLDYSVHEIKQINGFQLVHPEDLIVVKEQFAQLLEGKTVDNMEYRYKKRNGTYVHISNNASPIFDSQGNVEGAFGVARDISQRRKAEEELRKSRAELNHQVKCRTAELLTVNRKLMKEIAEHKKTEKKLRESEEKYRTIFESFYDVYYRTDKEGLITIVSPSLRSHAGHDPKEVIGRPVTDFFLNPSDREAFTEKIKESGYVNDEELKLLAKDGRVIDVSVSAKMVLGKDGRPEGVEGVLRDITKRKQTEKELVEAKDYAEKTLRKLKEIQTKMVQRERMAALGELSASVAHEVNNPLNVASGYAQMMLMEEDTDPEVKKTAEIINKHVKRASNIIDQLLKFSRQAKPEMKKINVNEAIENDLVLLQHQLALNSVKLKRQITSKPLFIYADSSQIQQVFHNLIVNASQAMQEGGTLAIRSGAKNGNAEISFTDTGCGIPKKDQSKLFEPFYSTKEKGTGLGLSIVYRIIAAHKGRIDVKSEVGKGSEFTVILPIKEKTLK